MLCLSASYILRLHDTKEISEVRTFAIDCGLLVGSKIPRMVYLPQRCCTGPEHSRALPITTNQRGQTSADGIQRLPSVSDGISFLLFTTVVLFLYLPIYTFRTKPSSYYLFIVHYCTSL